MRSGPPMPQARQLRLATCGALALISIGLLSWGLRSTTPVVSTLALELETEGTQPTNSPGSPAEDLLQAARDVRSAIRVVTLEYPSRLRVGDDGAVVLKVGEALAAASDDATEVVAVSSDTGGASAPASAGSRKFVAEARLEVPGASIRPPEAISAPLEPDSTMEFVWSITFAEPTVSNGTAWLFVAFMGNGDQRPERIAISAQSLRIESTDMLGMSGHLSRFVGAICLFGSFLLALPFLDETVRAAVAPARDRG